MNIYAVYIPLQMTGCPGGGEPHGRGPRGRGSCRVDGQGQEGTGLTGRAEQLCEPTEVSSHMTPTTSCGDQGLTRGFF